MVSRLPSLRRLPVRIMQRDRRVIILPFAFGDKAKTETMFDYVDALPQAEVDSELKRVLASFGRRHKNLQQTLQNNYERALAISGREEHSDNNSKLLLGAYFTMEYSIEGAALFNPSIVPHPEQPNKDELQWIMSMRATGEGHLSSVVFETGKITADGQFEVFPRANTSARTGLSPDQFYVKTLFAKKLNEMNTVQETVEELLQELAETFTLSQLEEAIDKVSVHDETSKAMLWLARSNYQLRLEESADPSELVIFPYSEAESRGIEDVRLVHFVDEEGQSRYYGTYTAYNGFNILPQLLETKDFRTVAVHTLNGSSVQNKGMALFPRQIGGKYVMSARIDGRNLYIMASENIHFWDDAQQVATPKYPWEGRIIGNCGSPVETSRGWLLLTHGVGPMRKYSLGAMLLDLEDPKKILGRIKEPLLSPNEEEREGYVPNVLYTCGSLAHKGTLYIPYAMSDKATAVATVNLEELVDLLLADGP